MKSFIIKSAITVIVSIGLYIFFLIGSAWVYSTWFDSSAKNDALKQMTVTTLDDQKWDIWYRVTSVSWNGYTRIEIEENPDLTDAIYLYFFNGTTRELERFVLGYTDRVFHICFENGNLVSKNTDVQNGAGYTETFSDCVRHLEAAEDFERDYPLFYFLSRQKDFKEEIQNIFRQIVNQTM